MGRSHIPLELARQGGAWYEGREFDVGARVIITDAGERARIGASAGWVAGYDASGPKAGEAFIRVLVQPDGPAATIVAVPPTALSAEDGSERAGLARTILAGLEQNMRPERFRALLEWLAGPEAAALAGDPNIRRQRLRLGPMQIPGLVFPEIREAAAARRRG